MQVDAVYINISLASGHGAPIDNVCPNIICEGFTDIPYVCTIYEALYKNREYTTCGGLLNDAVL